MSNKPFNPVDILAEVYEKMYEDIVLKVHQLDDKSTPVLQTLIEESKANVAKFQTLSKEEANLVAEGLKRDMEDMSTYLSESEHQLEDWLGFETALIKQTLLEQILLAADKTTVQLLALNDRFERNSIYKTGEIKGPGTLCCDKCGEILHFHKAGKVPPCPKCHSTDYHRGH